MNWDAIGAIAELLGAVGVIASLVYLAGQIRHSREQMGQNTQALQASGNQQFHHEINSLITPTWQDEGLANLISRGHADYNELSDDDVLRFDTWLSQVMITFENSHYHYRIGMLDKDLWNINLAQLTAQFRSPGVAQWWASHYMATTFSPEFAALVEEILGEERDRGD